MSTSPRAGLGLAQVCLAGVLWGTGGLGVQVIREHVDISVLTISAWRMAIAAVVLLVVLVGMRQLAALGTLLRTHPALSRLLPDTAWLSDLTIQGNIVTINGYADDAAAVLALIEGSPQFSQAEFRSPSTRERVPLPDGTEREVSRYSLSARAEPLREVEP